MAGIKTEMDCRDAVIAYANREAVRGIAKRTNEGSALIAVAQKERIEGASKLYDSTRKRRFLRLVKLNDTLYPVFNSDGLGEFEIDAAPVDDIDPMTKSACSLVH